MSEFVKEASELPLYQLPHHLASFPRQWPFPRGDLYHWIPVLNRFDHILELFNKEYGLDAGPQTRPFARTLLRRGDEGEGLGCSTGAADDQLDARGFAADGDREAVQAIIGFTKLLLENCGNRSLYSSSGHLNSILNTTSLSLLEATLRLGLRLAQRYHTSRIRNASVSLHNTILASHYNINLEKVQKLAAPFSKAQSSSAIPETAGKGKERTASESDKPTPSASSSDLVQLLKLGDDTREWQSVVVTCYETGPGEATDAPPAAEAFAGDESPATPTPSRRASNLGPNAAPTTPRPGSSSTGEVPNPLESPSVIGVVGQRASESRPKIITIDEERISSTSIHDVLEQECPHLPESSRFELLNKLRIAYAFGQGKDARETIIGIRLLAIANLAYIHPEAVFQQKIGQPDSEEPRRLQLANQLSELVHPPSSGDVAISRKLQTLAMCTLEALLKQKTKAQDVVTALSVNVNHGVLFYIVRKAVAELGETEQESTVEEDDWREALFTLLNSLLSAQPRTGEAMVSAGLLEILVEVLTLRTPKAERNHPKILNFLDTFVYNLRDAFQSLVNANGLEIIAELTAFEVHRAFERAEQGEGMPEQFKTKLTDYKIPFHQQQTLRWLFKFLNHMLSHTGGQFDRLLRNLMDSPPLVGGLRKVISNGRTFGSTVWHMAVNILTSFIHNEPTSYAQIAEAGLSKALLEAVIDRPLPPEVTQLDAKSDAPPASEPSDAENAATSSDKVPLLAKSTSPSFEDFVERRESLASGILPVSEAMSTIPQAFGAICLNEAGMKLFRASGALETFFEIFLSSEHVKALVADVEAATVIGNTFDELVRHHPPLKTEVLKAVRNTVAVIDLRSKHVSRDGVGAKLWYEQDRQIYVAGDYDALTDTHLANGNTQDRDVEMEDADSRPLSSVPSERVIENEPIDQASTTQYIEVICRFLSGFFSNASLCGAYVEEGGLEDLLDFATLPCLPYNYSSQSASHELVRVVQMVVDQKPHLAMPPILKRLQLAVAELQPLLDHKSQSSFFASLTATENAAGISDDARDLQKNGTRYAKALTKIHSLTNVLTTAFQTQMFNHRAQAVIFTQVNLADVYERVIESLGKLHRSCVWEEILLQNNLSAEWEHSTRVRGIGFGNDEADDILHIDNAPFDEPDTAQGIPATNERPDSPDPHGAQTSGERNGANQNRSGQDSPAFKNTKVLRYLLSQVPTSITPFFQHLAKMLLFRRSPDGYQKQNANVVAHKLAKTMLDQLHFELPKQCSSPKDRYAYWIVILTSISQLMIDASADRTYPQTLTLIVQAFMMQGGFDALKDVLEGFQSEATSLHAKQAGSSLSDDEEALFNLALGGIKVILTLYSQLINSKYLLEANQTMAMQTRRDNDRERHDSFVTQQFLVELRLAVVGPVKHLWDSELLDKATSSVVETLIDILKNILEGDSEGEAYKRADNRPMRAPFTRRTWRVRNGEHLQRLKDLGFDEDLAREALYRCNDNMNMAREYCNERKNNPRANRLPVPEYDLRTPYNASPSRPPVEEGMSDSTEGPAAAASAETSDSLLAPAEPSHADVMNGSTRPTQTSLPLYFTIMNARVMTAETITVEDLEDERNEIRANLIDRSLDVLNTHNNVTFQLSDLITAAVSKANEPAVIRAEIGNTLIQSLVSLQPDGESPPDGKRISATAHLLALVIQDKDFYEAALDPISESFSTLLSFIDVGSYQSTGEAKRVDEPAPWIGQILLIIERLLAEDCQPHQIQWNPPASIDAPLEEQPVAELPPSVVDQEDKNVLFDHLMDVMKKIGKDESMALSVVRVLVILTRNRYLAKRMGDQPNLRRLFLMVKQLAGISNDRLQSAFMLVLRHVIEDDETIRQIMRSEIHAMFEGRDRRQTDTTSYTRQMYHLAIRAPEIFVEVTNEKLMLARYESSQRPQVLALKKPEEGSAKSAELQTENGTSAEKAGDPLKAEGVKPSTESAKEPVIEKSKPQDLKLPVVENPDGVVHFLLNELLTYKEVEDKESSAPQQSTDAQAKEATPVDVEMFNGTATPPPTLEDSTPLQEPKKSDKPEFKADEHPIYIYRCFLLQCLTELLSCYNRTKIEFINFSRKADPRTSTPSKPRSGILNYLLNALLPFGTVSHADDLAFRKKYSTSNWAISVVVSLCSKTGEHGFVKTADSPDDEPELLFVRKFVLEHALKAFKDANTSSEALDMKYSRLLTLADLFNRMLTSKPNSGNSSFSVDMLLASQKQLARIMYEKNFISILTGVIADIDLNFPNAKRAVKYILRPLKLLTQTAIELSMSSDSSTTPGQTDEDEISTASSVSEVDNDNIREQTPDLFRNSALGILEPRREEEDTSESDEDDDEDEEMYGDEYADDMEYDEDIEQHAEEDAISDEEEGMGPMEDLPGDVGMDVEVVIDGEDDDEAEEDDEDADEDMEDDDEDEDGEDVEILDEITGDDENASMPGADDEDWESEPSDDDEGEDVEDYPGHNDIEGAGEPPHPDGLDDIVRVLEGHDHHDILQQLQDGGLEMDVEQEGYLEDDMQDDEDDEDDEDDYEEDDIVYEPEYDDDDEPGLPNLSWGWDGENVQGAIRGHHHHHHHHHRGNPWGMFTAAGINERMVVPPYRAHRPSGPQRSNDDGTNPLLQRSGRNQSPHPSAGRQDDLMSGFDPRPGRRHFYGVDTPVSLISNLLTAMSQGGPGIIQHGHGLQGDIQISIGGQPMFPRLPMSGAMEAAFRRPARGMESMARPMRDDPSSAVSFTPTLTMNRWQDEARLLFGNHAFEKAQRVITSYLRLLVPPAIEAEKERRKEEAERRARKEKEAEEARAREQKEQEEREAKEKQEREEREAREAEEAAARERERAEAAEAEGPATDVSAQTGDQIMEGVETTQPETAGGAADGAAAGPAESRPRVVTNIRGRELDITGLGIDLEYLDALPEELREEVLMQQVAEQRSQAAATGEAPSEISREFLEALPEEIREELLQQEAHERRRREREEARRRAAQSGGTRAAEEMDPASFLATLEPNLRQAVLMEQDDEVLAHLPEEIASEARQHASDRRLNQFGDFFQRGQRARGGEGHPEQTEAEAGKRNKPRPIVQMLDKAGVATLLRLMFIPLQGSAKQSLNGVLRDVSGNRQNRAEVISMLLSILADSTGDINSIDKSFQQLSLRAKPQANQNTPKTPKRSNIGQLPTSSDMSPVMVTQQCLETLYFLTQSNAHISSFFLVEHETAIGSKSKANRKGKGKETKANKYPINSLLNLLDRKLVIESSSAMEKLASLLVQVTNPLAVLLKKEKEKPTEAKAEITPGEASATAAPAQDPAADNAERDTEMAIENNDGAAQDQTSAPNESATLSQGALTDPLVATAASLQKQADDAASEEPAKKVSKQMAPPEVPEQNLRLVVNIIAARECSSKTFQNTLSVINNLSAIPGAKEIFGRELIRQAQELADAILKDLAELTAQIKQAKSGTDVQGLALSKFSPASSDQAKLLRVLTALDYLFDPKRAATQDKPSGSRAEPLPTEEKDDILITLYENSTFGSLWNKLSECLTSIRQRENMFNVATILLPAIESLMVVCKNTTLKDAPLGKGAQDSQVGSPPPQPESRIEGMFFNFTEEHRKILNDLVRHNPKLMSGSFSLLVKNSKVLEFDNKRNYFNRRLHTRGAEIRHPHPSLQLSIRRSEVFLDSFKSLYFKTAEEMKYGKLNIRFHGEEGVDAGGVSREWFQSLSKQMFDENYALWQPVSSDRTTFHPSKLSGINQEHLMFFKFIGRIIGKALYEGRVLDCHFSRAVYKRILGKPVGLKDMESLEPDYYKSLVWMLENDVTDIVFDTFSVESDEFGDTRTIDLVENGRNIQVTQENKAEYVRLITEYKLTGSVQEQLEHFLRGKSTQSPSSQLLLTCIPGFHDIVPAELISIFNEQELELLISGLPNIDVDDWKNNSEYHNYTAVSPQVQWYWRAVRSFNEEERAKLLQFITGTSKVPLNGFKELEGMNGFSRFNIHRDFGSKERLPSSHTCFNRRLSPSGIRDHTC